jgi:hypothetical protein
MTGDMVAPAAEVRVLERVSNVLKGSEVVR